MRLGSILLLAVLGLAAAAGGWAWRLAGAPAAVPAVASRAVPTVKVAQAERRALPVFVRGIGRVAPLNTVQVKSRIDGQIDRVLFEEGAEVKAGEVLVAIDPRPYAAAVGQAEGQLQRDEAQLSAAKADLERNRSLLAKGFASRQAFDQQEGQAAALAGAVSADEASVESARLNLSFATIRAPIAGRIGKRLVDAGNVIHASDGTPLAEIVQIHPVTVLVTVPQGDLLEVRVRQKAAALAVEAWSADDAVRLAAGTLVLIGNEIDPTTGTIELKASFANTDDLLWPGQFVDAHVVTRMRDDAVAVPSSAVQPGPDGKFVYVLDGQSVVHVRPVRVGPPAAGLAVIEAGITPGETVVIDNQDQLAPETKVVVDATADPMGPRAS